MNAEPKTPTPLHLSAQDARSFSHINTWIFDLDNTLYPHEAEVWPQVDDRITTFIADMYGLDGLSARALQKYYYHNYGTTLKGLMDQDDLDPTAFLDFVHTIDHSKIELNEALGTAIKKLEGRKLIFTNGSKKHAENITKKLGIYDLFDDMFDIVASNYSPKPERSTYEYFLKNYSIDPMHAAMFEDIAKNLLVPHELGMTTVLVIPRTTDPFRESFEQQAKSEEHIDYITNDLAAFIENYALKRNM